MLDITDLIDHDGRDDANEMVGYRLKAMIVELVFDYVNHRPMPIIYVFRRLMPLVGFGSTSVQDE